MCHEQLLILQKALQSRATKVPLIIQQRVEARFPALRESLVSAVFMFAQKRNLFPYWLYLSSQGNRFSLPIMSVL
jgi:hypothetical protein